MNSDLLNDEDIVISGIGFKLPGAENLSDLTEKLFGKKTLIAEGSQNHGEEIKDLKNFDFTFFGISNVVARDMDPMTRKILERTFEAVIDAGLNPTDIKGTDASVFCGSSFSDYDLVYLMSTKGNYAITGRDRCMNANRVSYWLDLKGYSVQYDAYYANGIQNIVSGWDAIRKGYCDTAIVSTANFKSAPEASEQMNDLKKLSPEEKSRSYDDSADGWRRSDGVAVFVLQRANIAKRCYAVIEHALSKIYGDTPDILQKPSQHYWELMLNEFYAQSKLKPNDISYVEGDGTGIKEDDAEELNALTSVFDNNRTSPLLLGSIKSNIGHTEGASASCAILKAIISMEQGVIPKNKHYKSPNSLSPGLINGKVKVVDKNVPLPSNGLIAINVFSMPSIYGHMILRANPKVKKNINCDQIPRLVPISVRQDEFFDDVLDKIEAEPYDPEQINLLQGIFSKSVDRYLSRGYTILPKMNDVSIREHQVYDPVKRPLWFIFSGMGSQWTQMGKRLMDLPLFRTSIEKSHEVLKKKGLNLVEIITTDDPKIFDNILHSFVGIAAIQIALVDLLSALDIVPDNIIGHSVGELGCSYADGCLTAEQTILCAYSRGKASVESSLIKGFMAAIGKGYNQIKDEIPDGIEVACHNAADSCTISGPAELVQNYVKELQDRKIFARTVNVSNIAYHSQYIKPAAPKLLEYLKEVIPEPKLRSEKWISTSNLEENWNTDLAKYCSPEYHTNNLLSSVYFEEGSRKIPENAICIEIAPHGLLQAILKRSLGKTCINIPLTNRTAKDELIFFLQAVGKMYMVGLNPKIQELYPKIEYPVSRGTGSLHQFIRWEHDHVFPSFRMISRKTVIFSLKERLSKISMDGIGYVVDENNYYPFSIFIVLIWENFASSLSKDLEECPVIFENIKAEKLMPVHGTEADEVSVHIGIGTGQFAISTDRIIVSGTISSAHNLEMKVPEDTSTNRAVFKTETDVYDRFYRKNTTIGKYFKNINSLEITENVRRAKFSSSSDWLQTLESMIQLKISENESQSLLFPLSVRKLIISPETHKIYKESIQNSNDMAAEIIQFQNIIKCGGIEMKGLQLRPWSKISSELKLESIQFAPFVNPPLKNIWRFVDYCFGIVVNNSSGLEINILETGNRVHVLSVASYLQDYFSHTNIKIEVLQSEKTKNARFKYDLVISNVLKEASPLINENGFIFAKFPAKRTQIMPTDLEIISKYSLNQDEFILFKKKELSSSFDVITIPDDESTLCQIIKGLEDKPKNTTYLIGYYKDKTVKEIIKKHLWKDFVPQLRWVFIYDNGVTFDVSNPVFADQLKKGLVASIYFNGSWGTFYQRQFREEKIQVDSIFTKLDDELTIAYFGTDEEENFKDMNKFQVEYSGKIRGKTHVMGIASVENKKLMADDVLQWNIPPHWTLEDGATVPLTYSLMYFYLKIIARILPFEYESVLITDGLSYNGRAAISVAQALELKIYVTVNEEKEISQLRGLYPFIEEKYVLTHDDDNFDVSLNLITKNSNPHVIINNLEEDKLLLTINSVPEFSRIFHFGKKDIRQNNEIGMHFFLHNVSFFGASSAAISGMSVSEKEEIRDFVKSAIEKGLIKPLPRVVCSSGTFKNEIVSNSLLKKLFLCDTKCELNRFSIHPEKSYLIIDDESNTGLKVSEWLILQNVRNIIISSQNPSFSEKTLRALQKQLQRQLNIIVVKDSCETELLKTAKRLGPLAAVFYVNMEEGSKSIVEIDRLYRNSQSILVAISKDDSLTELCAKRTKEGYTSTNFIWKAGKKLSYSDLNFMLKLCGEDFVFLASDGRNVIDEAEKTRRILSDTLPNSIETFCDLGSSLSEEVRLIELANSGLKSSETKETSPIFILSGLQDDPKNIALPLSRKLMYPVYLVRLPNKANEFSVEKLGSAILSKIQLANKYEKCYNILGISWGSYVAVEVSRLLEKSGARVSLMLIDVPKRSKNMRTSLEKNLIEIVRDAAREMSRDVSHLGSSNINSAISNLNLPDEKTKKHMKDAVNYIHNCLRAVFNYDYSDIKLKGPVTIMNSSGMEHISSVQKICKDASVKNLPVSRAEVLICKETVNIINGSAIAISMSDHSIHNSAYDDLENFLEEERLNDINNRIFITGTQKNISW